MQRVSTRRLVAVTGFSAGDTRGHAGLLVERVLLALIVSGIYADKDRQEAIIRRSDLDWTLVRPGLLTNGRPKGTVQASTTPDTYRLRRISRTQVADFLLDAALHDRHVREAPVIFAS